MSEANPAVPATSGQGEPPATPAVDPAAVSPPSPPAPAEPPKPFWESIENAETRGYLEVKGFKTVDALAESYRNFEKLRGVPQERLLTLPEDMSDATALAPILEKLGYAPPKTADDYGFSTMEGVDPEFAKSAAEAMREIGVPKAMAEKLAKWQIEAANAENAKFEKEAELAVAAEKAQLQADWGSRHDAMLEQGRRAARVGGLEESDIANLESSVGYLKLMKFFANVGGMIGESTFIRADDKPKGFELSPEGAKAKITQLRGDQAFASKLLAGDAAAKTEWERLHILASANQGGPQ